MYHDLHVRPCSTCGQFLGVCGNPRRRLCESCYFAEMLVKVKGLIDKTTGHGPQGNCHVWSRCKADDVYGTCYLLTPDLKDVGSRSLKDNYAPGFYIYT